MNQSALKTFAQGARNKLRQLIGARLDYVLTADTAELRQQAVQVNELRTALKTEGRDPLIERVAYTWFNRLAALRFMDANGYQPFGARVITPAKASETLPEVLQQARAGALDADLRASIANLKTFEDLLAGRIPVDHPEAQVFKLLLVAACNYYHRLMPFLFEKIGDATELLLPDDLLTEHSIVADFRQNLTDQDCQNEEVLGWFYQYYISEKKDEVMGRNAAVPKQDIPAVTQLFTPHWIVRYLVENSLGRLWLLNRPQSKLREKMPYYIESGTDSSSEASAKEDFLKITKPEDIRLLDPAGGSGHMLTYAFDLLYAIYEEEGYDAPEIPGLILRHNLYGVDICDRAVALAAFALCMKARAKDNRFFRRVVQPHLISLQEIRFEEGELKSYVAALSLDGFFADKTREWIEEGSLLQRRRFFDPRKLAETLLRLIEARGELLSRLPGFGLEKKTEATYLKFFEEGHKVGELAPREIQTIADGAFRALVESTEILNFDNQLPLADLARQVYLHFLSQFEEAKNFGSLIQPCLSESEIRSVRFQIGNRQLAIANDLMVSATHQKILRVLEQAEYLCQRYHVVVANPPYMGSDKMNPKVKELMTRSYASGKGDLSAAFMLRSIRLTLSNCYAAMITFQNWMFISSFEPLRLSLLDQASLVSLIHCGRGVWGADFGSCAFVFERTTKPDRRGHFRRLFDRPSKVRTNQQLEANFFDPERFPVFSTASQQFRRIDGAPIAYWLSEAELSCFTRPAIKTVAESGGRCKTHGDHIYVRFFWEVDVTAISPDGPWKPLAHGGDFQKWYGNRERVFAWSVAAREAYASHGGLSNSKYWNREGICWSDVTIAQNSFRIKPADSEFSSLSPTLMPIHHDQAIPLLGFLNTHLANNLLRAINPTLHANVGDVQRLPFVVPNGVDDLVLRAIESARADWDNFETSWDFRDLPLLRSGLKGATLAASWQNWKAHCDAAIRRMQELETENNRLFIAAYGLQDELQPEVPEDQITLARADTRKDMVAFLSYAIGCMFGRYSLDAPGLILADAGATVQDYLAKVPNPTFAPDPDGILPVLDGEWFTDDIVARCREFLRLKFGEENLTENIAFIEASLGKVDPKTGKVKPMDLRTYFVREFYKNHISNERAYGYKKRPIYWMFSSPEGSFQALIYLHRYTRDTVNVLLNDYVREFIHKLEERHRHLTAITLNEAARPGDRTKAQKELGKIDKMLKEIRAWERDVLLPLAQQRIELDLDDGVKVNYQRFHGAVIPIAGLEKQEDE